MARRSPTPARATTTNFDVFPSQMVRLGSYWLGGARVAYAVDRRLELFARAANAFDALQDVFGYRTEGRSLYAGIRLASAASVAALRVASLNLCTDE